MTPPLSIDDCHTMYRVIIRLKDQIERYAPNLKHQLAVSASVAPSR